MQDVKLAVKVVCFVPEAAIVNLNVIVSVLAVGSFISHRRNSTKAHNSKATALF